MNANVQRNQYLIASKNRGLGGRIDAASLPENIQWMLGSTVETVEVAGIRLWSAHDAVAEAELQAQLVPEGACEVWVYGIGNGLLIRNLLERDRIERVYVVVLNVGVAKSLLSSLDHSRWLADRRVTLIDAVDEVQPKFPRAIIPSCLELGSLENRALCDQLRLELKTPFERERQSWREPRRLEQIEQNLELVASDGDVQELFGIRSGATVVVALAGPSLLDSISWLNKREVEGPIIAVDGALQPLLDAGVAPEIIVTADDSRKGIVAYFSGDLSGCTESTLVYAPVVHHDALVLWPGRRLTAYTFQSIYDGVRQRYPKGQLYISGSVAHMAVDLAVKMGASRVIMVGADFGFPADRIHANPQAPVTFYEESAKMGLCVENGHGELIKTLPSFNGYRIDLERYIAQYSEVSFINWSRAGARIKGANYWDEEER